MPGGGEGGLPWAPGAFLGSLLGQHPGDICRHRPPDSPGSLEISEILEIMKILVNGALYLAPCFAVKPLDSHQSRCSHSCEYEVHAARRDFDVLGI